MLNIDWLKPFKCLEYSVGTMYVSIMNLSREYHFKPENILLIRLIPGPKEPPITINQFLAPLVGELLKFLDGIKLNVHAKGEKMVRCALLCVAWDIPACRKVNGFLSHKAVLGCSKCLKAFIRKRDYSGFDRV